MSLVYVTEGRGENLQIIGGEMEGRERWGRRGEAESGVGSDCCGSARKRCRRSFLTLPPQSKMERSEACACVWGG